MDDYKAHARSNYFEIKDLKAFEDAMPTDIEIRKCSGMVAVHSRCGESGAWPTWNRKTNQEIDIPAIVSEHLVDGNVAIFMEAGASVSSYVVGHAEAINSKGERSEVSLGEIYRMAEQLGNDFTRVED